mgnify:CR=1 FL=1
MSITEQILVVQELIYSIIWKQITTEEVNYNTDELLYKS